MKWLNQSDELSLKVDLSVIHSISQLERGISSLVEFQIPPSWLGLAMSSLVTLLKAGQMRIGNILQINLKNCFWHGYNLTSLEFFVNTYLQIADSLHQDHMKGMHQKPMFFPVLWPPCFHQQWMPLKGYSPPWNNPDWPQTLLALSCWHWVEPKIHQLATSVVWSAILRSYFLRVMVYLLHPVYKHARGMMFFQIIHNSLWLHIGL